jgi:hypothetical protein
LNNNSPHLQEIKKKPLHNEEALLNSASFTSENTQMNFLFTLLALTVYWRCARGTQRVDLTTDNSEISYVNSGQSVVLVCDLPNNMPDGQVCLIFFCFVFNI